MTRALIKKENDFLGIWAEELGKRNEKLIEKDFFQKQSKIVVKNILDASRIMSKSISQEDFLSIAKVLKVIISLQEDNYNTQDISDYLESLLIATKKAFPSTDRQEIQDFERVLKHLIVFIHNQYSNELVLKEEICYLEKVNKQNILSMVGSSRTIERLIKEVTPILDNNVTVLVQGETGTGKELMARAIYSNSNRKNGPFIALNCAAIPDDLMESEMFGHKKGAFTDAIADRPGKLELANNGILFLDEINELPLKLQSKLLRVIQEKKVVRVGEVEERDINIKIVCATNQDLKALVDAGKFREDLFYRINVYNIVLPALRNRPEDIIPLAEHFFTLRKTEFNKKVKGFSNNAIKLMLAYSWPGNIRELDNVVTRSILKTNAEFIDVQNLDIYLSVGDRRSLPDDVSLKSVERNHIERVLERNNGNMQKTAKELGITRTTLYNKIKDYA